MSCTSKCSVLCSPSTYLLYIIADRKLNKQHTKHQRQSTDWANEDVNRFKEEEFDFQANLDMFDKAKVFAEIQVRTANATLFPPTHNGCI
jgi:flagellar basal body rod protein FlgB